MPSTIKIEFKNAFGPGFLLVFLAVLLTTLLDQSLNKQIENLLQSQQGLTNTIWFWGALSLLSSLLFPLLTSFLCAHTLANLDGGPHHFLLKKFELGLIETLRAWGKTFLWCFVFIIPGLIQYTYYLMAPFVVMFSKKYEAGEVDALDYSKKISKKFWHRLNFWLLVFYMILPLAISSLLDEYQIFRTHPITATLTVALQTLIFLAFHYVILKLFLRYLNEFESDPNEFGTNLAELTAITPIEAPYVADV